MIYKKFWLILVSFVVAGCSTQAYFREKYIENGLVKTKDSYSIEKILKSEKSLLLGFFKIKLNDQDITEKCDFAMRSNEEKIGHFLEKSGEFRVPVDKKFGLTIAIGCIETEQGPGFLYEFKEDLFRVDEKVGQFGLIDIALDTNSKKDHCKKYPHARSPRLIGFKQDTSLLEAIS